MRALSLLVLGGVSCGGSPSVAAPETPAARSPAPTRTRVVVLGTGTPVLDPERSGPCVAVVVDDRAYLVDMGPGLVRRAMQAALAGERALDPVRLDRVFVTHLHSDHTVGFPDLWLSPWVVGRPGPLHVVGPPGTAAMAKHLRAAWAEDIAIRVEGTEDAPDQGLGLEVVEVAEDGVVYRDDLVTVKAFKVPHGSWKVALGYRFEGPDRTVVISGDTGPSEAVVAACSGCDLLVHEVYSQLGFAQFGAAGFAQYHSTFHTSTVELAGIAARAKPAKLLLYHQLYMGASDRLLVQEIQERWKGEVVSAADLGVY